MYGEKHLAVSPNGNLFLQKQEDDYDFESLSVLKMYIKVDKAEHYFSEINSPSEIPE